MNKKFGKLVKVDLREIWDGDSVEFNPWLSQKENITELGNLIGMDLRIEEQETRAGIPQAGLLCKDLKTNDFVLIENQLDKTNFEHLGKLICRAAGLESVTLIWIAGAFTADHWAALQWLNKITNNSINFIGIELEAYKIGDSLPALNYKVAIQPEDWTRQLTQPVETQPEETQPIPKQTDAKLLQQEYWKGLKEYMEASNSFVKLPNPPSDSWYNIPFGRSKFFLSAAINSQDISINIWLTIIGERAKDDFDRLYELAYKDSLLEVNQNLIWDRMQADIKCAITLKNYADYMEKGDRLNQYAWFKENLEKFDKYFRPKIRELL